ncbi:MAG TPA: sigma-70 family RNA polymerase sigma factor, partial [bacterium]|nr:sigma-70 family RNA polymerase sigma factor [bacterium]
MIIMDEDHLLMARVASGCSSAFNQIIKKYQQPLLNFVYRLVGDRHLAEEVAQEAFLRVYLSARRYRPETKFSTYLYQVARNVSLNALRHRKFVSFFHDPFAAVSASKVSLRQGEENSRQRIKEIVSQAIGNLPVSQRTALVLAKYDGLSVKEIALIMKTSLPAVKSLLHRARETLKKELAPLVHAAAGSERNLQP